MDQIVALEEQPHAVAGETVVIDLLEGRREQGPQGGDPVAERGGRPGRG
jgi:hypothetical protein